MMKQAISLRVPRFVARKPIIKHGTYIKYGFAIMRHQYCTCPSCRSVLNAGPNYQPNYCSECGQRVDFAYVQWEEEIPIGRIRKEETCE